MNFFEAQAQARRRTALLVVLFAWAVAGVTLAVYAAVSAMAPFLVDYRAGLLQDFAFWDAGRAAWVIGATLTVIVGGSLWKSSRLRRDGGKGVAEALGGRQIPPQTREPLERRLLNVVEEMALASGMPAPPVYVLEDSGINAFAAGFSTEDAVIGVTRGAMQLLSRDQLQGVVAHEFSHLLNGDSLIKMRMMGLLFGMTLISDIGTRVISGTLAADGRYRERWKRGVSPPALLILGALLFLVGLVGAVLADLIKRAVSRQREFLADAAAVQFTRNPEGLAGALKVIGGYKAGGRVAHAAANQASHFFFANALKSSWGGGNWWTTHPPLVERIRRLDPSFSGRLPKVNAGELAARLRREAEASYSELAASEAGAQTAFSPAGAVEAVGAPAARHVRQARRLRERIPPELRELAHEPHAARAMVFALLLDADKGERRKQLDALEQACDPEVFRMLLDLSPKVMGLAPELRLPLAGMLLPALGCLSFDQYCAFRAGALTLIRADDHVSLREYLLYRLIIKHLDMRLGKSARPRERFHSLDALMKDARVMLAWLAHAGATCRAGAESAWKRAMQTLGAPDERLPDTPPLRELDRALDRWRQASPVLKERLLHACAACVLADERVTVSEADILRVVAASLDCPMPPLMHAHASSNDEVVEKEKGGMSPSQAGDAKHVHVRGRWMAAVMALAMPTMSIQGGEAMTLSISSTAFEHQGRIPSRYTCEGADVSPPLSFSGTPEGTRSLALIVDDPDAPDPAAPKMTWVHWVLYNLPADTNGLTEAVSRLPAGTREGLNDWQHTGYGGPCPPIGRHRYFFKLYALDVVLPDLHEPDKAGLERAMRGHVLEQAVLMGTYQKGDE